jgi:hypothetical protein
MAEQQTILGGGSPAADNGTVQNKATAGAEPGGEGKGQKPEAYDYTRMLGTGGGLADDWRNGLPEDIRGEKCLDSIKTIGTLAKSYVCAQRAMGTGKVAVPGENSSKEEWDAFYRAGGRPDSEDGYSMDGVELPEGVQLDDEEVKAFRRFAFENGVSQKVFQASVKYDAERAARLAASAREAQEREFKETMARLKADHGASLGDVLAQCNRTMDVFGLRDTLEKSGLLNNYAVISALARVGSRITESRLVGGGEPAPSSPAQRLADIMGNPDDAYFKADHPGHRARVDEVRALLRAKAVAGGPGN